MQVGVGWIVGSLHEIACLFASWGMFYLISRPRIFVRMYIYFTQIIIKEMESKY